MVSTLFEEAHERGEESVYTPVFNAMKQATVKAFITGEADELLDDKIVRVNESWHFTRSLVCHPIKLSTSAVPLACLAKQQTE